MDRVLRLTMLGDSLTAGFGLAESDALPARLQAALRDRGFKIQIENAGISGDTTAGGLARLDYIIEGRPDVVLLALGANDALRGLSPAQAEANLAQIVSRLRQRHIRVILLGMYAPLYQGDVYGAAFNHIHAELANASQLPLYPFLLDGVALMPEFNQEDGMHPNEAGVAEMVRRLTPFLAAQLEQLA